MLNETALLIARINDIIASVYEKGSAFTHFLSESELAVALPIIAKSGLYYNTFGGYDQSDRKVIGISLYDVCQPQQFPITALYFKPDQKKSICHRDVLGAIMALGIKRSFIGDIIFFDGLCCFFAVPNICEFIISNLTSVADMTVEVRIYEESIRYERIFERICCGVMSMRLDCIVSAAACCSRAEAEAKISAAQVFVNSLSVKKKDYLLKFGDVMSIRHTGKFKIDSAMGNTKKGRIKLMIFKYI